jgi:hypothetical protein
MSTSDLPRTALALLGAACLARAAGASTLVADKDGRATIQPGRADQPPVIDGRLDDAAWKTPPLDLPEWVTYNPMRGQRIPQKTEIRVSYDDVGLYVAFHCLDPDPAGVRATLSRHDQLFNDDWVGLSLDAIGNGQSSYDLFVNPLGVQGDILNSATDGENVSPDWVWDSAGRRTPEGYDVELRVPWKNFRFASGRDVRMRVLFWRRVSRIGTSASWPALADDKPFFENHARMLLHDLKRPLALELVPSATFSRNEERANDRGFGRPANDPELGLSVKYGLTSTTTVEATVNPDFSQVESDAFQMEVNQRYPVFYSEKRPFFMEGLGTFQLAGSSGDSVMRTAVHTRRIVDPAWGGKASGSLGRLSFAALAASDTAPGRAPDAEAILEGRSQTFLVSRATYSLGPSSYAGAILTDTELASGHNRVAGADFTLSRGSHQWTGTFLASRSRSADGREAAHGLGGQFFYVYDTKRWTFVNQAEHYDRAFRMDTAFLKQTGITSDWSYAQLSLYPDPKRHPWFKRFSVLTFTRFGRDEIQGGDIAFGLVGVQASFTRQGSLRVDYGWGREPWAQRRFPTRRLQAFGGAQLLRWLNVNFYANGGRSVFYDTEDPFVGSSWSHSIGLTVQPGASFSQSVSWDRYQMDRPDGAGREFRVELVNLRTTYQFDRRFALRGILRYDSAAHRVLGDLLASFEPVPGTVAYAGYGALVEQHRWDGAAWQPGGDYLTMRRGLFLKASYAKRF